MNKIAMTTPIVEMDGDEMTRVLWQWIKEILILPHVNLRSEYYDLGLCNRDKTEDKITTEAALACMKHGVAVKCATITPNDERVNEYNLRKKWRSPNATIRGIIGGTIVRRPITLPCMKYIIPGWKKPITIARHAYGDIYSGREMYIDRPGLVELVFTPKDNGEPLRQALHDFTDAGIVQGVYNTAKSVEDFGRVCFEYAMETQQDLWFGTKDTISQTYDALFKKIFMELYENEYKDSFSKTGLKFIYTLIDDAVARVMRSEGGYLWACKNYDGDVMSDLVSTVYGSLSMMSSVLIASGNIFEYEAAHGTVTRHYYQYKQGQNPSTNPIATIFAWGEALKKRGQLDGLPSLQRFGCLLEEASLETITSGYMTKDLACNTTIKNPTVQNSRDFLKTIGERLSARYGETRSSNV
jgi:isocitrate dehydrogenase